MRRVLSLLVCSIALAGIVSQPQCKRPRPHAMRRSGQFMVRSPGAWQKKEDRRTLAELKRTRERKLQLIEAHCSQAQARMALGDQTGALDECDQAIELAPAGAEGYSTRGTIRYLQGDLDEAIADFDKALDLSPGEARISAARRYRPLEAGGPSRHPGRLRPMPEDRTAVAARAGAFDPQGRHPDSSLGPVSSLPSRANSLRGRRLILRHPGFTIPIHVGSDQRAGPR